MSWIIKLANFQTRHKNFSAEKAATSLPSAHSGQNKKSQILSAARKIQGDASETYF